MSGNRTLPEPVKPRRLIRHPNPGHGSHYLTSDGRYEIVPRYRDTPNGGRTARIEQWAVKDLRDPTQPTRYVPLLDDVRHQYCAPDGRVPWLVCDMDEGVMHVAASRTAAVGWSRSFTGNRVLERGAYPGSDCYDYVFGIKGEDSVTSFFIMRADVAHRHGFDPVQQPRCPYPDAPFERARRPGESDESWFH